MTNRLSYKQLKNFEIEKIVNEGVISDIDIIGQNRAIEALLFSLAIESDGYNIYLAGEAGQGKATAAKIFAKQKAKLRPTSPDLCYVYNFLKPKVPLLIQLPTGHGLQFQKDMEELIEVLLVELPKAIGAQDFEENKTAISKDYTKKKDEVLKIVSNEAKKYDFGVKTTGTGIYFMPIVNGIIITEEEYNNLEDTQKEEIMEKSTTLQDNINHVMNKIREYETLSKTEIEELEFTQLLFVVGRATSKLFEKYISNDAVLKYLKNIKEDILDNLGIFIEDTQQPEDDIMSMLPWNTKKEAEDPFTRYKVNLIVDNSNCKGAPVIVSHNPTYQNLVGEVEYDNEFGNFTTDFMKIKAGLLHKANNGYLILRAKDLNIFAIEALLRSLKTKEVVIEPIKEFQTLAVNSISPSNLKDLNVKVILIGDFHLYDVLQSYEEDFRKLFKIRGDFDYEMSADSQNINKIIAFINIFAKNKNLEFSKCSKISIIENAVRLSGRKDKITTNFGLITELCEQAAAWASFDNSLIINKNHVIKALDKRHYRNNLYEEKITSLIDEEIIMINTTGSKIGQVNGLAVIDMEEYAFAKPTKITATSYAGKAGVINIEKEARLSGKVHDKGVQVLAGYLGNTYAKEFPLSISLRIGFEQNYSGIDGDSASSAELFAIISSISETPLTQELAVTGSLNQFGEIQAIGGATEKIEGFFDTCNKRGLTGNQGVVIPIQNTTDLVLKDEVIEAVKQNKFHIFPISNVNQGIELLTGESSDDIHHKVQLRLKKYSEIADKE